jgi:hypothetical protein
LSPLALVALALVAKAGGPRVAELACQMGDHRTGVLVPREDEDSSDDELDCRALVAGVGPGGQLAVELRVLPPLGPFRVVATSRLDPTGRQARLEQLLVPHSTWSSAVDWRNPRSPRLRLELRVYARTARTRWGLLTARRLDIRAWPRASRRSWF